MYSEKCRNLTYLHMLYLLKFNKKDQEKKPQSYSHAQMYHTYNKENTQ